MLSNKAVLGNLGAPPFCGKLRTYKEVLTRPSGRRFKVDLVDTFGRRLGPRLYSWWRDALVELFLDLLGIKIGLQSKCCSLKFGYPTRRH